MLPLNEEGLDLEALDQAVEEGAPGSPTAKLMKVIAPPNAAQSNANWSAVSDDSCGYLIVSYRWWCDVVAVPHVKGGELMWRLSLIATAKCECQPFHR